MAGTVRLAFVAATFLPLASLAHHSAAGRFDTETIIEIEGVVIDVHWVNPHASVIVETIEQNGDRVTWVLEANALNTLRRSGIQPGSINVGDQVKAAGWKPLTTEKEIFATNILVPSGEELFLQGGVEARWNDEGVGDRSYRAYTEGDSSDPDAGMFRTWSFTSVSPFLFPEVLDPDFDLHSYPLTSAATAQLERFDRATDNPTRNCTPKGMPTIMEQPYPMEIVRDGDDILLRIEEYDTVRRIHMDQDEVPAAEPLSPLGYSIGRWEDENETTLVVTTTHLNWPFFNQLGIPQSEESVLVERFTTTPDGSRLDYEMTVTDPVHFTNPVSLERYWLYLPDIEVLPYQCDERI